MTFNFDFLKNIVELLKNVSDPASRLINCGKDRKQKKREEAQEWYNKVVCMKEEL